LDGVPVREVEVLDVAVANCLAGDLVGDCTPPQVSSEALFSFFFDFGERERGGRK
jgi:hypothetical protein